MQILHEQSLPLGPISTETFPFFALADSLRRMRRAVRVCVFLRLNPLRARDRQLFRFLAG